MGKKEADALDSIAPHDVLFSITDVDSLVAYQNKMHRIGDLLCEKEIKTPKQATLKYHKKNMAPTPEDPKFFTFERLHNIVFSLGDVPATLAAGKKAIVADHAASLLPVECWQSPLIDVIWNVELAATGFTPQRPFVVFRKEFEVPIGHSILLSK